MSTFEIEDSIGLYSDDKWLKELNALKKQVDVLNMRVEQLSSNHVQSKEFVQKTNLHQQRARIAGSARLIILCLITLLFFAYELYLYFDTEINKISQSTIEGVDFIDAPYIYMHVHGILSNISTPNGIIIQNDLGNVTEYTVSQLLYNDNFIYDSSITVWTLIHLDINIYNDRPNPKQAFLIPPYGAKIPVGSSLRMRIRTISYQPLTVDNNNSTNDELLAILTKYYYAMFWQMGPIQDITHFGLVTLGTNYALQFSQLQYASVATVNYYYIDVFEEINKISKTKKIFYTATSVASVLNEKYLSYIDDTYWIYYIQLILYPHESGGYLYKNILTISQKTRFIDLLAEVGGIFSPLSTFTVLLLFWAIFGVHSSSKYLNFNGIAPLSPLDQHIKLQIKLYLIQLGVLNEEMIHNERNNKDGDDDHIETQMHQIVTTKHI